MPIHTKKLVLSLVVILGISLFLGIFLRWQTVVDMRPAMIWFWFVGMLVLILALSRAFCGFSDRICGGMCGTALASSSLAVPLAIHFGVADLTVLLTIICTPIMIVYVTYCINSVAQRQRISSR